MGELRARVRDRSARRRSIADGTIVAWDYEGWSPTRGGRPGHTRPGTSSRDFLAGFQPQRVHAALARAAAAGWLRQRSATPCRRTSPGASATVRRHRRREERARAQSHRASRRSSPARCARRRACRTPSRTSASWTNSRRTSRRIRSSIGCVTCANRGCGRSSLPQRRRQAGRRVRRRVRAARRTGVVNRPRRRLRALRRRQRLLRQRSPRWKSIRTPGASSSSAASWRWTAGPISNPDGIRNQVEGGAPRHQPRAARRGDLECASG